MLALLTEIMPTVEVRGIGPKGLAKGKHRVASGPWATVWRPLVLKHSKMYFSIHILFAWI